MRTMALIKGVSAESAEVYEALGLDESGKRFSGNPPVLSLLSSVLERNIQKNEKLFEGSKKKDVLTIFHGSRPPTLSIRRYIERIFKYSSCSASCFVVAYIYIDRFLRRMNVYITALNVHRLLITSTMVAAKFLDDECYNNAYYAKVGGVSTEEMNSLEMKFLFNLDFRLNVSVEVFQKYCLLLQNASVGEYQIERQMPTGRKTKMRLNMQHPQLQGTAAEPCKRIALNSL